MSSTEVSKSAAVRTAWEKLGKKASGREIIDWVKRKYGFIVPTSVVSLQKKKVWGAKSIRPKRVRAPKAQSDSKSNGQSSQSAVLSNSEISQSTLFKARDLLLMVGGDQETALEAIKMVASLQV